MKLNAAWLNSPVVKKLILAFAGANTELRFVGGCVRDTLLNKAFSDIDAATPLAPQQVIELLEQAGIQAVPTGIAHGTITAVIDQQPIQITTLRRDMETDGRRAKVEYTDIWEEDAARRDFTMNALYLSPNGTLYDYYRGSEDAHAGRVRFIGEPQTRIREDYLRILRFFRFNAHYGVAPPDEAGLAACKQEGAGMEKLSGERISIEMLKLLSAQTAAAMVRRMEEAELLVHIGLDRITINALAKLESCPYMEALNDTALLKLACLLPGAEIVTPLAKRWKFSRQMQKQLRNWHAYAPSVIPTMSLAEQKKSLRKWGRTDYIHATLLSYAKSDAEWKSYAPLMTMVGWNAPVFPVSGEDLKECGVKPGKSLGDTLKRLEQVWEDSNYRYSKEDLLRLI